MNTQKPLVIYHGGCNDGFCAAWLAWKHFNGEADFHPANYGEPPPDVTDRTVYILDFSYKRPVMLEMAKAAKKLFVLDHHKTAAKELEGLSLVHGHPDEGTNIFCKFDMAKSGGRLTWEHFAGIERDRYTLATEVFRSEPWLVAFTEDRDLWLWKLHASKEINAALASYPREFETWDMFSNWKGEQLANFAREGAAILRYQRQLVDLAVQNAVEIEIDGHKVLSVNTTCLVSEIGERLAKDRPFGATFFIRGSDGKKIWSLRSRDGGIDVSEVAKRHGGGGHKQAAGYEEMP